jgi:ornithine cyclodeaminase/alanine dehydrogenase-like protein (mu-crystallin family)
MSHVPYLDAAAITEALPPADAVNAIADVLTAGFDPASDTARTAAATSRGHFLLMPSEVGDFAGVKVATVAPGNPAVGLPRIQAGYPLFDAATLTLRAILDGTALTTLRTPAVSVAAIRPVLGRIHEPLRVVLFGAGPQAVAHLDTLAAVLEEPPATATFVVRRPEKAAMPARERGKVACAGSDAADAALAAAHVVICATSARTPLFAADALAPEAIVVAIGSHEPDARELDGAFLASASVIVEDVDTALREAGDIVLARSEGAIDSSALIPMAEVVRGTASLPSNRPVVFKSVGMSWQDLTIANAVFSRACSSSWRFGWWLMPGIGRARSGSVAIALVVLAMLVAPRILRTPMARFLKAAVARGADPAWTVEASSPKVTSLMWWLEFSIDQWPLIQAARSAGVAWWASRLVTA